MGVTIMNKFGKMQGWNCLTVNILGRDLEGITQVDYDDNVDKANAMGANKYPIGRGEGNYSAKFKFTLYKEEVDAIQAALPKGMRIQDIPAFPVICEYETNTGKIQKDIIQNAEFTNRVRSVKQGDGTTASEYVMIISHIDWNV